ncbi:nucleoside triphosphate pyrophosphohydrolase [Thermoleophilia bacterium SCSIO 60948]|nr:nucleoside triphosphate pyrophosphohydrolase [Thermoleophilia bacterium SCSIO 60948]
MGELGVAIERLDELTRLLRVECPWDREQDERSIVPHTVEEAYELADAAARGDDVAMHDELGDVLFQVVFLSMLLSERGSGDLTSVVGALREKLIRRHPHVFGESSGPAAARIAAESGADTGSSRGVLSNWDRIKVEAEGRGADDPFADVPETLPGPTYARKMLRRADKAGIEGPAPDHLQALDSAREALDALFAAAPAGERGGPTSPARDELERRLGALLLASVDVARQLGVDPELALRREAERLRD